MGQRTEFPARGLVGGGDGSLRKYLVNGVAVDPKARITLMPGDRIMMQEAGGGGYGNEKERDLPTLKKDQEIGYIS
jgi:N-methylhydantoinase B